VNGCVLCFCLHKLLSEMESGMWDPMYFFRGCAPLAGFALAGGHRSVTE
jgi:hypothetical protein